MGNGLTGKTVVLAASRKTDEMTLLIEKQGGKALIRPMQGTVFLDEEQVKPDLQRLVEEGTDVLILTTGIGTETLLSIAENIRRKEDFLQVLQEAEVASRGYKTFGVLKKLGVTPFAVDEDGTTAGLAKALVDYDFQGKRVTVQLHGDPAPRLIEFLTDRGATVLQLLPYQHIPPEEHTAELLCKEIIDRHVDAVCFTTAIQVRSLLTYAQQQGIKEEILMAFTADVLAVSVGKVTSEAMVEEGITRYIAPELERMGAMIIELSRYYDNQK
ncbi:uroporphyrinogen-III synthase [Bacillus alkalicellulosilyticus]|uniref:uroporphyrinogen-III synthase n=1 Tax=Alkalihalobacterium alkalicellulosilyticum TaxID=1912214 RepID=UPI000996DD00|nr:uroporphyrinogen-III synthase [Bacillus alkalicellulosilyticus]